MEVGQFYICGHTSEKDGEEGARRPFVYLSVAFKETVAVASPVHLTCSVVQLDRTSPLPLFPCPCLLWCASCLPLLPSRLYNSLVSPGSANEDG